MALLGKSLAWFVSKRRLIQSLQHAVECYEAEKAKVEDLAREYQNDREDFDRWLAEFNLTNENKELRTALRLAEEDNDRLYRIIAALRTERGSAR